MAEGIRELGGHVEAEFLTSGNRLDPAPCLEVAQRLYENRRKRGAIIGKYDLFGEPAWDILLDLYIAYARGLKVSVSSACIGSAVPSTTALRWLGVLQEAGLIVRENDSNDHRRMLVRLSNEAIERMERFFRETEGKCVGSERALQSDSRVHSYAIS